MINIYEETKKHLDELEAFSVPNPIVAKAITLQRLMKTGISEFQARKAIDDIFNPNKNTL